MRRYEQSTVSFDEFFGMLTKYWLAMAQLEVIVMVMAMGTSGENAQIRRISMEVARWHPCVAFCEFCPNSTILLLCKPGSRLRWLVWVPF